MTGTVVRNQQGLTLIEIMIVVAIIAVIAGISLVAWQNAQKKARLSADLGTVAAMRSAVAMYYGKHNGNFPPNAPMVQSLILPNPPVFQCPGQAYTYESSNGMIRLTVNDVSLC
jgi:prepilin-type N-terminal cleavage/methylation domain-containing protein